MKKTDVFYVSEHRGSYEKKKEFKNIIKKNLDLILMPISITRFSAEKALILLNKLGLKIGIIHLINLKPFKLEKKWIEAINSTKHGVLMTDNDYKDGILRTLAHKINESTKKTINVMGLDDRTAGHHRKADNLPPDVLAIKQKVLEIIK